MCSSGTARTGSWKFLCVECGFLNREKGVAKSNEKFDCCDSFGLGTNLSNHSARDYIRTYRRKMVFRNRRFVGCLSGNDAASPAHAPLASNFLLSVLSRAVADTAFVKLGYKYNQKLPRRDRDPFLVTAAVSTACDSLNYRATSTSNPPQAVHTANLPNSFSATRQQCICPADLGRRSLMREQEDSKSSLQGEVRIYNKAMKPHILLHSFEYLHTTTCETDRFSQYPKYGLHSIFFSLLSNILTPTFGRVAGAYIDFWERSACF
jgi:hypothetical protein